MSRRPVPLALLALLALPSAGRAGDPVPDAIDALLALPEDAIFFAVPIAAPGAQLAELHAQGETRCVAAVDDVTGDGWAEIALGRAPGQPGATLELRDGAGLAPLWSVSLEGGFRTLSGLDGSGARLAVGLCGAQGEVQCRATADGALLWSRALAGAPAEILAVRWQEDLDGDDVPDLLVGGGDALSSVTLLSGRDGATLWTARLPGGAAALHALPDLDDDGRPDHAVAGGDDAPFVAALSAQDGSLLWRTSLPGPGAALATLPDVDGDGVADLACGYFAQPQPCLRGVSGATGAPLWESAGVTRDVTSLATISDVTADGLADVAVGSFDNAISAVSAATGVLEWRREMSTNNTGALLPVGNAGDLDGNGYDDVLTASVDRRIYLLDGEHGHRLMVHDMRSRGTAVLVLPDATGDGRGELFAAGQSTCRLLSGASGTAVGPVVIEDPAPSLHESTVRVFALPGKPLLLMGALGDGALALPGFAGVLGLALDTLSIIHFGIAPAAGESGYLLPALPREFAGLTIRFQGVTIFGPGNGIIGPVTLKPLPAPPPPVAPPRR